MDYGGVLYFGIVLYLNFGFGFQGLSFFSVSVIFFLKNIMCLMLFLLSLRH